VSKEWQATEIRFLIEASNNSGMTYAEVSQKTGRSISAIHRKAIQLHLKKKRFRFWTKEEDKILSNLQPGTPMEDILDLLPGRSPSAMDARRHTLGVRFPSLKTLHEKQLMASHSEEEWHYIQLKRQDEKFQRALIAAIQAGHERGIVRR
jgi:hypothetical protein